MKKIRLLFILIFVTVFLNAQEGFKIGVHGGIPLGDYNDKVGLVLAADIGYMWAPNKVIDLGIKSGFIHGFPETFREEIVSVKLPSIQFAPVAASIRIWPSRSFSLGGDIGQAFGINDGNEGGFYYRPQIGFQTGAQSELNFSYTAINQDGGNWSMVTMGFVYTFLSARHFR